MDRQGKTARPALKICGITKAQDLALCLDLEVAYVGFNLYEGSKRHIPAARAAALWRAAAKNGVARTQPVAVMVNPTPDAVAAALGEFPELQAVQLHGDESPAAVASCRDLTQGRAVWKALGIGAASDLEKARAYVGVAALVLCDAPPRHGERGGTGQTFDWAWLKSFKAPLPLGVAGGVKVGRLAALASLSLALIDVCSGVEVRPGEKDRAAMRALHHEFEELWA